MKGFPAGTRRRGDFGSSAETKGVGQLLGSAAEFSSVLLGVIELCASESREARIGSYSEPLAMVFGDVV